MNNQKIHKFDYQKSKKKTSTYPLLKYLPIERYFTRPLASLIVRALFRTSITPNQLTFFSFFLGICSTVSFFFGVRSFFILGGILAQLGSVFDCADGILARSKHRQSHFGGFLDIYLDRISDVLVVSGVVIGYYIYSHNLWLLIVGLCTNALNTLNTLLVYVIKIYKQDKKMGEGAENRGFLVFTLFVLSLVNRLDIFIYALLLYSLSAIIYNSVIFFRLGRKINQASDS